jgi:hypothetical protein
MEQPISGHLEFNFSSLHELETGTTEFQEGRYQPWPNTARICGVL